MKITFKDLKVNTSFYRISDFKDLKQYQKISKSTALNTENKKVIINQGEIVYTDKGEINKIISGLHWRKNNDKSLYFLWIINPFRIKDKFWNNKNFIHRLPSKKELNKVYA